MTADRRDYEAIVLGLGGIGSATAYWLSKRFGSGVLGLERFELGHVRGESQDHSRIIRLSYHAPEYVRLAQRAYQTWHEVERDSGDRLIMKTGGLDLGPRDGAIDIATYAQSMRICGVPFEELDAAEIRRRWPQWNIGDDIHGLFQADSGIAMAAHANATHQRMARECGAELRDWTPVIAISESGGEFQIRTENDTYRTSRLCIAAGPWSNEALANFDLLLPLEVTKEQVTYFGAADLDAFAPERFPVWIWMDDPSFYGFPIFGENGPKVAQDAGGKPVDPNTRGFEPDESNSRRVHDFLAKYLPSALGPPILVKTCLYTLTPDRDFVVDRLPTQASCAVAIGAGHAFKFASVLGRILSELVTDGRTPSDLSLFSLDRPILKERDPARHYMV
ncbi:MAG TPA: N-methyl-L-tryptophan oxidase [Candidatus Eremiobacteraceae bacterium]